MVSPKVAIAGLNAPKKPRRSVGTLSAMYVAAPVTSPPAKKPCAKRSASNRYGASTPSVR
ncbi:MAG TPA: hypothetical protein VKI44_26250 [Acetobacteraceae bacterium]|nr:hypothetical protein [Acetobacteraceae bacterium]